MDTEDITKVPPQRQILKYKNKGILEIQCPSGIWCNVDDLPESLMKKAFKKDRFNLFKKEK